VDLVTAITKSGEKLGYSNLKDKQVETITSFVEGNDTFVSLPTSYGKSLIYAALSHVFDMLRGKFFLLLVATVLYCTFDLKLGTSGSITLCISPLTSLMMDRCCKYGSKGLQTEFIGQSQTDLGARDRILRGEVQLIYVTPETIIEN